MIDQILHRWQDIEDYRKAGIVPLPHFVDFHTSYACNQNCKGCAYGSLHNGKIMDRDKHFQLVDFLIDIGVKAFDFAGGGEPTMIPYLRELMQHIKDRGCYFGLITNGTRLNDEFIEFLCKNATYVRISLEASNVATYMEYKGVKEKMWNNAFQSAYKLAHGMKDFTLKFSVGKSLCGEDHYEDALDLACFYINASQVTFKALRHEPEELSEDRKKYELDTLEMILQEYQAEDIKIQSWITSWKVEDVPQCWLTPLHTVFDVDGNMYICCYYYCIDNLKIGNIFEGESIKETFNKLWYSPEHIQKIKNIDRRECAKVDCKFFHHHKAYDDAVKTGNIYFM